MQRRGETFAERGEVLPVAGPQLLVVDVDSRVVFVWTSAAIASICWAISAGLCSTRATGWYDHRPPVTSARLGTICMPAARSLLMSALIVSAWPGGYWVTIWPELSRP